MIWSFFNNESIKGCIQRLRTIRFDSSFERMEYTDAISALEKAQSEGKQFDYQVSVGL